MYLSDLMQQPLRLHEPVIAGQQQSRLGPSQLRLLAQELLLELPQRLFFSRAHLALKANQQLVDRDDCLGFASRHRAEEEVVAQSRLTTDQSETLR